MEKPILKIIENYSSENELQHGPTNQLANIGQGVSMPVLPAVPNPLSVKSIRHNSDDDIFAVILISLAKAYTDLGWAQPSDTDKDYMANELADIIPAKFPSIRLHEIPEAFSNGIRGKYGKFYGLSVVTFENFIEAHLTSDQREQFAKEITMLPQRTEPDINTKFTIAKNNALKALQNKKNGRDISLVALTVYTFLNRLKLIQYSAQQKWDFVDRAKEILIQGMTYQISQTLNKQDRHALKRTISDIEDGSAVNMILNMSKRVALLQYFDDVALAGANLDELIDSNFHIFEETEPNNNKNENNEQ